MKTMWSFGRTLISGAANLTRGAYRLTVVRSMNESRRRRGLPELDQKGRRSLARLTVFVTGLIVFTLAVAGTGAEPAVAAPDRPAVTRVAPRTVTPAPTTTRATPTPTPTYSPEPPPDVDLDIDVDDHVNLPDGALTGGYCARKWWC